MPKNKSQQYFYLHTHVSKKLNRLETEMDFYLQRENRTLFSKSQELSRWIEGVKIQCKILNSIHTRSASLEVIELKNSDTHIEYKLSVNISIIIYKTKI